MTEQTFLLVHGAFHGAWCWESVVAALAARGRRAIAIDLPGHGADPAPPGSVELPHYVDRVEQALAAIDGPVTLVGHSLGGVPTTIAASRGPAKVRRLIQVAAMVPGDGMSVAELSGELPEGGLGDRMVMVPGINAGTVGAEDAHELVYHDCPPASVDGYIAQNTPQPILPLAGMVLLPGALPPSGYVVMLGDRVIPAWAQRTFASRLPNAQIIELDGGHMPMLAQPEALAEALLRLEA